MVKKYLIVGNPNTGKTTLFNTLTGAKEKTANYSGVTVSEKERRVNYKATEFEFVDLPGIYSLNSASQDEVVTKKYLTGHTNEPILFVCSSEEIKKNMILLSELASRAHKILVVVNKIGKGIDDKQINELSSELRAPILQADVRKDKDIIFDWISSNLARVITKNVNINKIIALLPEIPQKLKVLDNLLLHQVWGKLIFCIVFASVLIISYGKIGAGLSLGLEKQLIKLGSGVSAYLKVQNLFWLENFWSSVVIGGVGQVVIYLPQLALMLTLLFLLEETGYLPRAVSLFNYRLEKFGMNGKSIFSLIMGVGCTTSAVLTTRNIGTMQSRRATVKFLPFVGCSAKLPILIFITQMVMGGRGVIYIGLMYLAVIVIGSVYLVSTKEKQKNGTYFISELPKLKLPSVKLSIKRALIIVWDLFKKITLSVFFSTLIIWLLLNLTPDFKFFSGEKSILEVIAGFISIIFIPLGIDRVDVVISLISGLIAKENIMSTMSMFGGVQTLSTIQAITFLVFIMLYAPCIPAIKCTKCEFGGKFALKVTISQMIIAYMSAFVFATFAQISILLGFLALIICSLLMMFSIKMITSTKPKFLKSVKPSV